MRVCLIGENKGLWLDFAEDGFSGRCARSGRGRQKSENRRGDGMVLRGRRRGANRLGQADFNRADGLQAFVCNLRALSEHFQRKFGVRLGLVFVDTVSASFDIKELGIDESGRRRGSMVAVAEAGTAKPASDWPPGLAVFRQALQTGLADECLRGASPRWPDPAGGVPAPRPR
jgi:hypothetical protein